MTNFAIGLMALAQGTIGSTMVDSIPLRTALKWDSSAIEISLRDNSSTQMAWQETQTHRQQLDRIRTQLVSLQSQLQQEREEVLQIEERVENARVQLLNAGERLEREQEILDRIRPVVEQGAVAERQLNRQEQQVLSAQNQVLELQSEIASIPEEIAQSRARINKIAEQIARLRTEEEQLLVLLGETGEVQIESDPFDRRQTQFTSQLAAEQAELVGYQTSLNDAQARLERVTVQLRQEQETLDRIRPLVERGALSELDLNRQEQQVLLAYERVLEIESEISIIQDAIARTQARIAELKGKTSRFPNDRDKFNNKLRSTISRIEDSERDDQRYRSKYNSLPELSPNVKESRIE